MSNKKHRSRTAYSKKKQPSGGLASLILPIVVGFLVVAFIVFAIVFVEKRQEATAAGALQNSLSVPVITALPNPTTNQPYPGVERVSVKQAKELLDNGEALLYDVRSQASYDQSHAAGSISLPEADVDAWVARTRGSAWGARSAS